MRAASIGSVILLAAAATAQAAGESFRDCADCPEMIVVPAGRFAMGALDDAGWILNEYARPRHEVEIPQDFALARFELSWAEYEACVADGGCPEVPRPEDSFWYGTLGDDHPLIIGFRDEAVIDAYLAWLSARTGHSYRLPSEAEWEYAAGAGSWPATGPAGPYDCADNHPGSSEQTTPDSARWDCFLDPVGSGAANAFGLHDMLGNVAEWTADCWHDSFAGAPADGSAWIEPGCASGVIKGGTAGYGPGPTHSDWRWYEEYYHPDGFRVARDLP